MKNKLTENMANTRSQSRSKTETQNQRQQVNQGSNGMISGGTSKRWLWRKIMRKLESNLKTTQELIIQDFWLKSDLITQHGEAALSFL